VSKFGLLLASPVAGGVIVVGNCIRCALTDVAPVRTNSIDRQDRDRTLRDTVLLPYFGCFVPIYDEKRSNGISFNQAFCQEKTYI